MTSGTQFNALPPGRQVEIASKCMQMYRGNERGYGWADPKGAYFNTVKRKWEFRAGCLGWRWGETTIEQWLAHLRGEMLLGVGPLLDNGTVYWGCIDVDKVGEFTHYDFDSIDIIQRAKALCKTFVPIRSKSGGVHLFLHFNPPADALTVREGLLTFAARLGLSGNEIFPKQSKLLVDEGDAPSWVFMPYFGG